MAARAGSSTGGDLNESQSRAVRQTEGPVLILAGAGSGKTRVITARIAHLVTQGVDPATILAVTFTNKAANEMRERVAHTAAARPAPGLTISTFHSLCVRILRHGIEHLGYKSNFGIYTASDQIGLLRQIIVRKGGRDEKLDAHLVQGLISRWKNRGIPVAAHGDDLAAAVAREYQHQLRLLNAVDFDDLLGLAVEVLETSIDTRTAWQQRFHYIMVDEFQDTNRQQMILLRHLAATHGNVCVVGDDDQSIYGWRGAEISNILEFEKSFPRTLVVRLQENYRSRRPILETANAVIRHNRDRHHKRLVATRPGGEPVRLIAMPGDQEEAEFVVNEIWEANTVDRRPWDASAVLFRTNAQSRLFEETFRRQGIPYRILGGQSFFERREIRDVLACLRAALTPDDDVNLLRILNTPPRGIGETTTGAAIQTSIEQKQSVFATLGSESFLRLVSAKTRSALRGFTSQVFAWQAAFTAPGARCAALTTALLDETGYLDFLRRTTQTPEEAAQREANVRELIDSLARHDAAAGGLRGFLDSVSLDDDFQREDRAERAAKKPGVWLVTLHAAKGLEFPHVYLVGLEEGTLPHKRSLEEGTRDEERRLLYVGITRAMERLTITYCRTRQRYGQMVAAMPSSFLAELPAAPLVERLNHGELMSQPVTRETARGHFDNIRELLARKTGTAPPP